MTVVKNKHFNFLSDGGEIAQLIEDKDWSKTALGPPNEWPQSLKTMTSVMLNNPFGMNIMWGKDLVQIYNHQYSLMIGPSKHPKAIGQKASETFAEIWDIIGPMLQKSLDGESTLSYGLPLLMDRNGYLEECYFDFSYSPIKDENGDIGGVLVTTIETTRTKKTELELKEIKNQLEFAIDATELATFDYDPTSNLFYGNQRLNDWFGMPNFSAYKPIDLNEALLSIVEEDRERVTKAISDSFNYELGGSYDIIYTVENLQTKVRRIVNAKGKTWFDENNKAYRFNGTLQDITERKKAEDDIKYSEKNLRSIIHQAPIAMTILRSKNYVMEIVNNNALEVLGRKKEEILNKPILESMPELLPQGIKELLDNVYDTGKRFSTTELPIQLHRNSSLETAYINLSYDPLYNVEGNVDGILAIGFEVTQQVVNRKKIEENEQKLNLLIDSSELGTWEYDILGKKVVCSNRSLELLGCKKVDYTHSDLIANMHPEDLVIRNKELEDSLTKGTLEYIVRIIEEDKPTRWIVTKGKVFYSEDKLPVKILGTIRDITEDKITQQKLEERERKFRLLADSMPQQVWTADLEGNLDYFNASVYDYSGLTPKELDKVGWLDIVHPEDRDENVRKWIHSISTGTDFLFEHRFRKHDGEYRWKLSRALPQKDEHGNIQMWVGTSTDIQEHKLFTNELEKQVFERTKEVIEKNIDLEKINKELQSFVYISSHDLQEPLRKIQTFSTRILDKEVKNLSDQGKDYFGRLQNAANRMQMLIEDLLAYSRTGTKDNNTEVLSLADLVEDIKLDLKEDLDEKNATVLLNTNHNIKAIRFQFRQLLINLISNSLKFALVNKPPIITIQASTIKGIEAPETINLLPKKLYSHIIISDNGIGFDNAYKDKIFGLFQRLHGKHEYQGTGIGLAIVKKILDNHHGVITASGKPNHGATFDIYLPLE